MRAMQDGRLRCHVRNAVHLVRGGLAGRGKQGRGLHWVLVQAAAAGSDFVLDRLKLRNPGVWPFR